MAQPQKILGEKIRKSYFGGITELFEQPIIHNVDEESIFDIYYIFDASIHCQLFVALVSFDIQWDRVYSFIRLETALHVVLAAKYRVDFLRRFKTDISRLYK